MKHVWLYLLALAVQVLTIKAIVEAAGVVALLVTLAIVEVAPALQGLGAVLPRVIEVEGAVSPIPAAGVVIADSVTDLVALALLTLWVLTTLRDLRGWGDVYAHPARELVIQDVAPEPVEVGGAGTLVEGGLLEELAGATVVAGVGIAGAVDGILALRAGELRRADASGGIRAIDALPSVLAA